MALISPFWSLTILSPHLLLGKQQCEHSSKDFFLCSTNERVHFHFILFYFWISLRQISTDNSGWSLLFEVFNHICHSFYLTGAYRTTFLLSPWRCPARCADRPPSCPRKVWRHYRTTSSSQTSWRCCRETQNVLGQRPAACWSLSAQQPLGNRSPAPITRAR